MFFIVLGVIVIVFFIVVIASVIPTKKSRKRAEEIEAAKQEKIKSENEFKQKVKESPIINKWADEISEFIAFYVNKYPYDIVEFHFKGYGNALAFGRNLQDVWLPNMQEMISQQGKHIVYSYNFCEYGLPDLNTSDNQLELFSVTVAELVSDKLNDQGCYVETGRCLRIVDSKGYKIDDDCFGKIIYTPPKVQGEW